MRASRLMAALLPLALVVIFGCQVPGEEEIAQTIENVAPADFMLMSNIQIRNLKDNL